MFFNLLSKKKTKKAVRRRAIFCSKFNHITDVFIQHNTKTATNRVTSGSTSNQNTCNRLTVFTHSTSVIVAALQITMIFALCFVLFHFESFRFELIEVVLLLSKKQIY